MDIVYNSTDCKPNPKTRTVNSKLTLVNPFTVCSVRCKDILGPFHHDRIRELNKSRK